MVKNTAANYPIPLDLINGGTGQDQEGNAGQILKSQGPGFGMIMEDMFPTFVLALGNANSNINSSPSLVSFGNEVIDRNNSYDPTTSTFTALIAGNYLFNVNFVINDSMNTNINFINSYFICSVLNLSQVPVNYTFIDRFWFLGGSSYLSVSLCGILNLSAGETVIIQAQTDGDGAVQTDNGGVSYLCVSGPY